MAMRDNDGLLFRLVFSAIVRSAESFRQDAQGGELRGFALCTDDGLETLSGLVVGTDTLAVSDDPDLLFTATDWPHEPNPRAFDAANVEMQKSASSSKVDGIHVDESFEILVHALLAAREKGIFDGQVFLEVFSSDPCEHTLSLQDKAIRRLNAPTMVKGWDDFLKKWTSQ